MYIKSPSGLKAIPYYTIYYIVQLPFDDGSIKISEDEQDDDENGDEDFDSGSENELPLPLPFP
jgi:hypothetical protein